MGNPRRKIALLSLLLFALMASACGGNDHQDLVLANPMANPTLSFADSSRQVTSPGAGPSLVSGGVVARHLTSFDFEQGREAEAFEEIRVQAEAAGFDLELRSHEGLLPKGQWVSSADGIQLVVLIAPGNLQVELV